MIQALDELPPLPALAVIINCGTRWFTSLALASAHRTGLPLLVIDCESRDGSRDHLARLSEHHGIDFYWLDWPLRTHGLTLDALFRNSTAETLLLVDSDVEIEDPLTVRRMIEALDAAPASYGAGFIHAAEWMGAKHGVAEGVGFYAERMWIPLTLLRTRAVQAALAGGASFVQMRRFTEFPHWPRLSRWLGLRFFLPIVNRWQARRLAEAKRPVFHEYDTGARMHSVLLGLGYGFVALPGEMWATVYHYHGVTRASFRWSRQKIAERLGFVNRSSRVQLRQGELDAKHRLARYGIEMET
ncbi:MAG TPA: hypothetical protein VGC55_13710 [Dokdonella sp.]